MTACCLWCTSPYKPRTSGASGQRFCRRACRNAFWTGARRWVLRAVEAGLLSSAMLKAAKSSVHAAPEAVQARTSVEA
jgi:hypothetical protein